MKPIECFMLSAVTETLRLQREARQAQKIKELVLSAIEAKENTANMEQSIER